MSEPPNHDNQNSAGSEPRPAINMPTEIGGYQIQRVLGSGGMATVYAALQKQPRRTVALKVMKAGVASDSALRRFKREIEILGRLHHPYIAQVFAAGVHEDAGSPGSTPVPYFVMEYISGAQTIIEYIAAKNLDVRDRLKLFVKVCAAVEHGHLNKIIHRDLKPANILIDQAGDPKVIDFGVAHAAEIDLASQTMHVEAGRIVGTLRYMAPEQLDAKLTDLDARCDVYALGALLYKMLTGKHMHDLESLPVYEAARVIREETPIPPGQIKPEIRGDLETIILKAIDRDRRQRYRNAGSLGRDVLRYLSNKPIHARRIGLARRTRLFAKRNRTALGVSAIVLALLGIAAGFVAIERMRLRTREQQNQQSLNEGRHALEQAQAEIERRAVAPPPSTPEPFTLKAHTGRIAKLAFSPAGDRLVSASYDHSAIIWDLQSRQPLFTIREFDGSVKYIALDTSGKHLAASTEAGPIVMIDATSGKVMHTVRTNGRTISALALSPDGTRLAIASDDLTVRLCSAEGHELQTFRSNSGGLGCLAFSADGQFIAAGSQHGPVYVWGAEKGAMAHRFGDLNGEIAAIGFIDQQAQQNSKRLLAVTSDGNAAMFDVNASSERPDNIVRFNAADSESAAMAGEGTPRIVDVSINGSVLACAMADVVHLWTIADGEPHAIGATLRPSETVFAVAVDTKATWCAAGFGNGDVMLMPIQPR